MEGLGEISMKMDVGMLKGSLMAFQQYIENPDNYEDEAFMMMVLTGIFINSAEFSRMMKARYRSFLMIWKTIPAKRGWNL